jgi:beta-lactamase superfamily II metal-dependent hydrolase
LAGPPGGRGYRQLVQEINQAGVPIIEVEARMSLDLGMNAWMRLVSVGSSGAMLELEFGRARILLCPGADPAMIDSVLTDALIGAVDAVLLAEGGYEGVNPPEWLEALDPILVLISVEAGNPDGLPSVRVLRELEGRTILRTDQHGWIELITDGERLWVEVERATSLGPISTP